VKLAQDVEQPDLDALDERIRELGREDQDAHDLGAEDPELAGHGRGSLPKGAAGHRLMPRHHEP